MNTDAPPNPPAQGARQAYAIDGRGVDPQAFYALACDPHTPVAVQACAGAGKTWMLVSRMLRALLDGARADEVLAITFTKKAAAEMRDRLLKLLAQFSRQSLQACALELRTRGMGEAQAVAQAPAFQALYERLLRQGENLQVRTFHSWFSSLLDMAPQDLLLALKLPLEYSLLEDDTAVLDALWPVFWHAMEDKPDLLEHHRLALQVLGDFKLMDALKAAHQRRQERHFMAEHDWPGLVPAWPPEIPKPDGVEGLADCLERPAQRQRWLALAKSLGQVGGARCDAAAQALEQAISGAFASAQDRARALCKALLTDKGQPRQALEKWPDRDEALAMLDDIVCIARQEEAAALQTSILALARALDVQYQQHKRRNKLIDMVDLEEVAHRLLTDDVLSGWLQERLDWQFRYLLIDEFQDTSPLQWQALSTWLSSYAGGASHGAPVVFIVGDPKQSIYRFRRAEPRVFLSAQAFVASALGGHILSCDHTRRNAPSVVDAVNRVFLQPDSRANMVDFRAHTTQSEEAGEVIVLPMVERQRKASKPPAIKGAVQADDPEHWPWRDSLAPQEEALEQRLLEQQCQAAAEQLLAARHRLELLRAPGEPAVSCMVLARKRDRLRTMHHVLQKMGQAADMPEKEALQEQSAVQDVVSLISALLSPCDDLSLARALKSPIFSASDQDLVALADWRDTNSPKACFLDVLLGVQSQEGLAMPVPVSAALSQAARCLQRWRGILQRGSMHALLQNIYKDQQLLEKYAQLSEPLQAAHVKEGLCALLFQALQLEGGRFLTPSMWLSAWSSASLAAPAPPPATEGTQAAPISLLTIHGAKGLEADLVLILDAAAATEPRDTGQVLVDWPAQSPRPLSWIYLASQKQAPASLAHFLSNEAQERAREEINALYVAMTRAKRCLIVSASEPKTKDDGSWWARLHKAGFSADDKPALIAASPLATAGPASEALHPWVLGWEPTGWAAMGLAPDEAQDFASGVTTADDAPNTRTLWARKGEALHWWLERAAPSTLPDQIWSEQHARQLQARNRTIWRLDEDDMRWVTRTAASILRGSAQWAWDATSLLWAGNEVSVVHQSQLLRIDRLVHHVKHGIWVLDYKSSLRPDLQQELVAQLKMYQRAVAAVEQGVVHAGFITASGDLIVIA